MATIYLVVEIEDIENYYIAESLVGLTESIVEARRLKSKRMAELSAAGEKTTIMLQGLPGKDKPSDIITIYEAPLGGLDPTLYLATQLREVK